MKTAISFREHFNVWVVAFLATAFVGASIAGIGILERPGFAVTKVEASKTQSVQIGDDAIQFTGYPVVGSRVYYFLDSGPNAGKARPAIVLRAHQQDSGPGQLVDLVVFEAPDDLQASNSGELVARKNPFNGEVILFAARSPGVHQPGSWDWMVPSSTGE